MAQQQADYYETNPSREITDNNEIGGNWTDCSSLNTSRVARRR